MTKEELIAVIEKLQSDKPAYRQYQAFSRIGLAGQRPVEERYAIYGLDKLVTPDVAVLDVGCNIGCMSLLIAEKARIVYGYDHTPVFIQIADLIQGYLSISNCVFGVADMLAMRPPIKFDLILSLAVHLHNTNHFQRYAAVLQNNLRSGGHLVFESRNFDSSLDFCESCVQYLLSIGFVECWSGQCQESSTTGRENLDRKFWVLQLV